MSSSLGSSSKADARGVVTLPNDHGKPFVLTADLVRENSHFCAEDGELIVEKLYRTPEGRFAYAIVTAAGERRDRRAYCLEPLGDAIRVDDGACCLDLPVGPLYELLALALRREVAQSVDGGDVLPPAVNAE